MLLSAILVSIFATCSQWWFNHLVTRTWLYPIWSGFVTGILMGDIEAGTIAGATIQLAYLGWISAGGSMPGNLMVAGIFGTAFTIMSGAEPTQAIVYATIFSLAGIIINTAYMTINAFWVHQADNFLAKGNIRGVRLMNYVPSFFTSLVLYGIPCFAMIMLGADWTREMIALIPEWLSEALNVVAGLMPALGIAMLLNYLGKKKLVAFFFLGFFATIYLGLDTMSLFIFSSVIAACMYFMGSDKGVA